MSVSKNKTKWILALWAGVYCVAAGSAQDGFSNQQLADNVAQTLRQSARLRHFRVDIQAVEGTVELKGQVTDASQRDEAVRLTKAVPGVRQVRDRLQVFNDRSVIPVQGQDPEPEQGPPPKKLDLPPQPAPTPSAPLAVSPPVGVEPMPFNMNSPNDLFMKPPPLPPYAWPTYAPFNNYSRVAYPTLYPPDAWPGIGPFYPFPKAPLGYRSVTLTWQDGYWWYGKGVTGHDWWRVRYR